MKNMPSPKMRFVPVGNGLFMRKSGANAAYDSAEGLEIPSEALIDRIMAILKGKLSEEDAEEVRSALNEERNAAMDTEEPNRIPGTPTPLNAMDAATRSKAAQALVNQHIDREAGFVQRFPDAARLGPK